MTINNGYSTLAEFKAYVTARGQTFVADSTDDGVIEDIIEAASRKIDSMTARAFYARTETRLYDVPNPASRELELDDDLLTITTLTNGDDEVITSADYNLLPSNLAQKQSIELLASSQFRWTFDSNGNTRAVISVAGTWGWSATRPDDISLATLVIGNKMYRRYGPGETGVATITAAGVVITPQDIPPQALGIIRVYKKWI